MKKFLVIAPALISISLTAFAESQKLTPCVPAAENALVSYFRTAGKWSKREMKSHSLVDKTSFKNMEGDETLRYMFNVETNHGKMVARITLNTRCQMTTEGAWASIEDMDADDADAAQGDGSEQ